MSSISELHPLKAEMGDPLAAGDSLRDIIPLRDAKKHALVRVYQQERLPGLLYMGARIL